MRIPPAGIDVQHRMNPIFAASIFVAALPQAAVAAAIDTAAAPAHECPRKLSDADVRRILTPTLHIRNNDKVVIHYSQCEYGIMVWPAPITPDSQFGIVLDADGNLPEVVRKYGYHGDTNEGPSYRRLKIPAYPAAARAKGITGIVLMRVSLAIHDNPPYRPDAVVAHTEIVDVEPHDATELSDGLSDAVATWKFNPQVSYGNALSGDLIVPFRFSIEGQPVPRVDAKEFALRAGAVRMDWIEVKD